VDELRPLVPKGFTMAQFALRWILMFDAVSLAIPGAKNPKQARENAAAAELPALDKATMMKIEAIYNRYIRESVHHRW
jgi:aryl-alcohol dehydrogenase-like predicted oxidoreductase